MADVRADILRELRTEVIGPAIGEDESIGDLPYRRYLMGILYPRPATPDAARSIDLDEDETPDDSSPPDADEITDQPVVLANDWRPSSVGLSFFCNGTTKIRCEVWGARYRLERLSKQYRRTALASHEKPLDVTLPAESGTTPIFDGLAEMRVLARPLPNGTLYTVSLINAQHIKDEADVAEVAQKSLYQVGFRCSAVDSSFGEYPSVARLSSDIEEQELQLIYRSEKSYGAGHGCAAAPDVIYGIPKSIATEHIPSFIVPGVSTKIKGKSYGVLDVDLLSQCEDKERWLRTELSALIDDYEEWFNEQKQVKDFPKYLTAARDRLLGRISECISELREGLDLLCRDAVVRRTFALANLAMFEQMRRSRPDKPAQWYPFQLAFLLRVLPSLTSEKHADRGTVDLIWFPTGGGKTEAYLGAAAIAMFHRRITHGESGGGTAVITRYTLRLLTTQQFERTARLICACESIRSRRTELLGTEPITLGLWVGQGATPNTYKEAQDLFTSVRESDAPENPFQLSDCPWCGTSIIPKEHSDNDSSYGVRAGNGFFEIFCPSGACEFHSRLPVQIVDEALYTVPPTFLVATVDKFARLAWIPEGGVFFGSGKRRPPSLVIQDELHLLTGPLGTTMAVYEAAIDELCVMHGAAPKVIAATATIRRAPEQIKGIFGRTKTRVFPPPGLSSSNSYFAITDPDAPGRLYAGVMSQSHTGATSMISVSASLLQSPVDLNLTGLSKDAYWTLVIYHNSLRELGRTYNQVRDDVRSRLENMPRAQHRLLPVEAIVELTGNISGAELPAVLKKTEIPADKPDAVGVILCTNMLSVGVDIQRLGLMLVNGQPKTTAEYIQATSRVGRSAERPGLVIALYSATRPRDRSHYENFIPYHRSFYRFVEPTSVTPYALPARERALHAALVILVRHGLGLSEETAAIRLRTSDAGIRDIVSRMQSRVRLIDPLEADNTISTLDDLISEWDQRASDARVANKPFHYTAQRQFSGLLKDFGNEELDGWETLHSMRNVDRACPIRLM